MSLVPKHSFTTLIPFKQKCTDFNVFFAHHSIPLISIVVIQFWMFMCVSMGFHCFMHIGIHLHPFKIYDMRKSNANLQKISVPNDLHLAVQYEWLEYAFYWKILV